MNKIKFSRATKIGIFIVSIATLVAVFAPYIAPHDPHIMGAEYLKPSREHLLGTNDVGQDILSEIIYGTRVSLLVGFFAALITTIVGTVLGLCAGYFGKTVDRLITALTNIAMSIPGLPLTILLVAFMKPSKWNLIIALSITAWTGTARILRAKTKEIITQPYIKIEKTLGVSSIVIMFKHILPNLRDIILVRGAMSIAGAMVTEAGLSFLGLGTYGEKSWGSILRYAFFRNSILRGQVWWYLPPIICISITVLGFMMIGYYTVQDEK
ncbi:MAG: ABC transporter permease [Peptostreptococcaceae bacterium]|nr:ABC transporter permease [Peptostreptococcaceae bacterium]